MSIWQTARPQRHTPRGQVCVPRSGRPTSMSAGNPAGHRTTVSAGRCTGLLHAKEPYPDRWRT